MSREGPVFEASAQMLPCGCVANQEASPVRSDRQATSHNCFRVPKAAPEVTAPPPKKAAGIHYYLCR